MIDFNMPRTRFVDEEGRDLGDQFRKVVSECRELGVEVGYEVDCRFHADTSPIFEDLKQRDFDLIAHEAVDLMQAVQTMLHMLAERHDVDVQKVIADVIGKNHHRGYYE